MDSQEKFNEMAMELVEALEKKGLFSLFVAIGGHPESEEGLEKINELNESGGEAIDLVGSDDVSFVLTATFSVGEVALSDRVIYPERFKEEREFLSIMPLEEEIGLQEMIAEIMKEE